jgi:hypothetical protein
MQILALEYPLAHVLHPVVKAGLRDDGEALHPVQDVLAVVGQYQLVVDQRHVPNLVLVAPTDAVEHAHNVVLAVLGLRKGNWSYGRSFSGFTSQIIYGRFL